MVNSLSLGVTADTSLLLRQKLTDSLIYYSLDHTFDKLNRWNSYITRLAFLTLFKYPPGIDFINSNKKYIYTAKGFDEYLKIPVINNFSHVYS